MKIRFHTILVGFAIALLLGSGYIYFSHSSNAIADDSSDNSTLVASGDASVSTTDPTAVGDTSTSPTLDANTAFLSKLISLTKIKIDGSLFSDPLFEGLHDNSVALQAVVAGRSNPFAPVDDSVAATAAALSPVVTNQPSQITATTAVLNGAINTSQSVTSAYFEYGPTPTLGKSTAPAAQSLVSTFITKVTGLASGTTYFYRADAKINGVLTTGEIISFNTN